jgi:hypothetical protein
MKSARRMGFILAATLVAVSCAGTLAMAQEDEAAALDKRVVELYRAGKLSEAIASAQRSLAIREKALGPDHPDVAQLLYNLRASFYAGARALLVSHWSVDSEAATRLATSTFAIMKADPKLGRAAALRYAMLAYMNDRGRPLNAYPAF